VLLPRLVVKDLDIPDSSNATYFLRFFHGAEFIKYHKRSFLKFKKYAVEAFGIRIKLPADIDLFKLERQPLPDTTDYKYPPFYEEPESAPSACGGDESVFALGFPKGRSIPLVKGGVNAPPARTRRAASV
jgi:hypothetical protein